MSNAPVPPPPPPSTSGGGGAIAARAWQKFRSLPTWAQITAPIVALLVVGAALPDEEPDAAPVAALADTSETTEPENDPMAEAVDAALTDTSIRFLSRAQVFELVDETCSALGANSDSAAATRVERWITDQTGSLTSSQASQVIDVLAVAPPIACPDRVERHPEFLAVLTTAVTPTTTTTEKTTTTTSTTTTSTPPTTAAPATTSAPPPPPPPPPTTAPPPPPSSGPGSNADGSYKNCTEARERGGAPVYRGEPGYGTHLDRDGDGVGCEN